MTEFWTQLSVGRVVRLVGASADAIDLALDPLPTTAPAVVSCRPGGSDRPVLAILDHLESAAVHLYPAWLPRAETVASAGGAGGAAVRSLAHGVAGTSPHFGPFLADLADRALRGHPPGDGRFTAEVRAAGLARLFAASFGRPHAALLVRIPDGLAPAAQDCLLTACEWLAHQGGFAVGITGAEPRAADRIRPVAVHLPAHIVALAAAAAPPPPPEPALAPAVVGFPAVAGRPHPASHAERALEAALRAQPWAYGRAWNERYHPDSLTPEIRVDLMWVTERCAVEIDGPEHRSPLHYEADRRRDVLLQLSGFAVLRFTNRQVLHDIDAVLAPIEQLVTTRRHRKD